MCDQSQLKLDEIPIKRVTTHIFLGIKIHEHLSWKIHIDYISRKISKTIGIIKHIKSFLPIYTLINIYNAMILPHLNYGILVWGFQSDKLSSLQKICIRVITKSFPLEHTEKLFKNYRILKVSDLFKQKLLILYFKLN